MGNINSINSKKYKIKKCILQLIITNEYKLQYNILYNDKIINKERESLPIAIVFDMNEILLIEDKRTLFYL